MLDPKPQSSSWQSALEPEALRAALEGSTLLRDGPFVLTWKLSGAGIVGRVMDLPDTERRFVGRETPFGYEVALSPSRSHRHAFEPIAELRLQGRQVELLLRLHREQRSFALPFFLMGLACIASAALGASATPGYAAMSLLIGLAFALVPPLRARALFTAASERAVEALREVLVLEAQQG